MADGVDPQDLSNDPERHVDPNRTREVPACGKRGVPPAARRA
jgi:hypothetical protein